MVESCVNRVGVDVNTASKQLLTYVSGLGPGLAANIVAHRNEHGPFTKRGALMKVAKLGPRAFEQAATDYLLKPVTAERLATTLGRLRARGTVPTPETPRAAGPFRFPVKAGSGLVLVDLAKTTHFLLEDETVWAFVGERLRTTWKTLAEAEAALGGRVVRGHRHLLLRPEAVVGVQTGESGRLLVRLQGGVELEVSRGAAPGLKARLGLG